MKKVNKIISILITVTLTCLILMHIAMAGNMGKVGQNNILSLGEDYTAVITADKTLWMWGRNAYNQNLSGNTSFNAKTPVKVMDNVVSISCGRYSNAAIKTDGSLWMWGNNTYEQFTGLETYGLTKIMDDVASVSCGSNHFAAIKTDGSLWTWGKNKSGQLGIDFSDDITYDPIKIMDNVIAVSCGDDFTAAIKSDGTLWTWGYNENGELGTGTWKNSSTPQKIMDNVSSVNCGEFHAAAVKTDGTLWLWGYNKYGELGNDTNQNSNIPVKVMDNVSTVSCGGMYSEKGGYSAAVKTDGSLWMWGYNGCGQLGNGTYKSSNVPAKVMDNVLTVSCSVGLYSGNGHVAVIKTDGSVWAWGANRYSQIGDGTNNTAKVPIQVSGISVSPSGGTSGNPPVAPNASNVGGFTDVKSDAYYAEPVLWAVENKIASGTSATTFSPEETCTNAQILAFLWRASGFPEPTISNPFTDVKASDYYYEAALWAYENGLVTGSLLNGEEKCTRSMTMNYMWKAAGSPASNMKIAFTDVPSEADYTQAVAWAVETGVTSGTGDTTFSPNETCTRAQIMAFLYRDRMT